MCIHEFYHGAACEVYAHESSGRSMQRIGGAYTKPKTSPWIEAKPSVLGPLKAYSNFFVGKTDIRLRMGTRGNNKQPRADNTVADKCPCPDVREV